jgi:hypothetical protein
MSSHTRIVALVNVKELAPYRPREQRPARRRLFLTREPTRRLNDPNSAVCLLVGRGFIEAALARWVLGGLVWRRRSRDKWVGGFLCRLTQPPPEIWEIRVTEPSVQARLIGRFAAPDTLVITGMYTRGMLGKKGSLGWRNAMAECETVWTRLFPSQQPFVGSTIHDYVTENCDDFEL